MKSLDCRVEGQLWFREEIAERPDDLAGRLEMLGGRLCAGYEQRLILLGALLEHVGTAEAVKLGPQERWRTALALLGAKLGK